MPEGRNQGWHRRRSNLERDGELRTVARRSARWPRRSEEHCLGICVRGTTAFPTVKAVAESSAPTRLVLPAAIQSRVLTGLQQRLFRTGGRLIRHARYFTLQLAESYCRCSTRMPSSPVNRNVLLGPWV